MASPVETMIPLDDISTNGIAATGSTSGAVRLWSTSSSRPLRSFKAHEGRVTSVAFARNSKSLASGSSDRSARQWDVATGKEILTLLGHTGAVRSVAFAQDGETLATGSDDKTVRFWDLLTLATDKDYRAWLRERMVH